MSSAWHQLFDSGISAAAFLKHGWVGDPRSDVLISMDQSHSDTVAFVTVDDGSIKSEDMRLLDGQLICSPMTSLSNFDHANASCFSHLAGSWVLASDALITTDSSIMISVRTADCLPIFIEGGDYISVIHAGRRGTILGITARVCGLLRFFDVEYIKVWFGPCSCLLCYEIDRDTQTHFDLVAENKAQILRMYEAAQFINGRGHRWCTQCDSSLLYSYRCGDLVDRNVFYFKRFSDN